jgi:hypothetical protein
MIRDGSHSVRAVQAYPHPPERAMRFVGPDVVWVQPGYVQTSRLEPAYYDCGAFQFFRVFEFKRAGTLNLDHTGGVVLGPDDHVDINYPRDLELARWKVEYGRLARVL